MNNKKYKAFSLLSLIVTSIYCILNVWSCLSLRFGILSSPILEIVLPLDVYTWHVYGLFAVFSLIIKFIMVIKNRKSINSLFLTDLILHFAFSSVSLFMIYDIFLITY